MQKTPIYYGFAGEMMYARLSSNDVSIRVWIERIEGGQYGDGWSIHHPEINLGKNEFCANTWGDHHGLMASAMLSTGWFEKTGRNFAYPAAHVHNDGVGEIWKLTDAGIEWVEAQRDACLIAA